MDPQAVQSVPPAALSGTSALLIMIAGVVVLVLGVAMLVWGARLLRVVLALISLMVGVVVGMVLLPLMSGPTVGTISSIAVGGVLGGFLGLVIGLLLHRVGTALLSGATGTGLTFAVFAALVMPTANDAPLDSPDVDRALVAMNTDTPPPPVAQLASADGGLPDMPEPASPEAKPALSKTETAPATKPPAADPKETAVVAHKGLAAERTKDTKGRTRVVIRTDRSLPQKATPSTEFRHSLPREAQAALRQLETVPLGKAAESLTPSTPMSAIPGATLMAGIVVAAAAGLTCFVLGFWKPKPAACVVTAVVGATWVVAGLTGGLATVPAVHEMTARFPAIVWAVLVAILAAVGAALQLQHLRTAQAAAARPAARPQGPQSLAARRTLASGDFDDT